MKMKGQTQYPESVAELASIIKQAAPVCVAVGLAAAIGLVDVHLAGNLGPEVQAGVGIGDQFLFFAALMGTGIAQAAGSLIARANGAGRLSEAKSLARTGLLLALAIGAIASIATYQGADCLISWFSHDRSAQSAGTTYLRLCAFANTAYCLMLTQSAILRAAGKSFSTVLPWLLAATISIVLSISLPQIMPAGRAHTLEYIALAWNLGAIAAVIVGHQQLKKTGFSLFSKDSKLGQNFDPDLARKAKDILVLGLPIAATEAAWLSSNFFMYIILSHMPGANDAQAAWTIRLKIEEIAATPVILAFNMTAASLVGQRIGAGDLPGAQTLARRTALTAATVMLVIGSIVLANSKYLAADCASTELCARYAQDLLVASIIVYPLTAYYITIFGALEGAGCTLKPMLSVISGLFLLRTPLAAWLGLHLNMGMNGIVVSIVVSHIAVALSAVSFVKSFFEMRDRDEPGDEISEQHDVREFERTVKLFEAASHWKQPATAPKFGRLAGEEGLASSRPAPQTSLEWRAISQASSGQGLAPANMAHRE